MQDYRSRRRNLLIRTLWQVQDLLDAYIERKHADRDVLRYVRLK